MGPVGALRSSRCSSSSRPPTFRNCQRRQWRATDFRMNNHPTNNQESNRKWRWQGGFTQTDLLVTLAVVSVLAAIITAMVLRARANSRLELCLENMRKVNRAVVQFADEHDHILPRMEGSPAPGGWWWYKEEVKSYVGL